MEIAQACGISPVMARLIRNRGAVGVEQTRRYLTGTLEDLRDPMLLPDVQKGARIIRDAIRAGEKIRIIGDYDVDGICSAFILWRVIRFLGGDVDAVLPDRIRDGYGINERLVREASKDGVALIVTCDNGISAVEPLKEAADLGIGVVLTDHHEVPYEVLEDGTKAYVLPPAEAVIDPKCPSAETGEPSYPFTGICGAVVAYKLCQVLLSLYDSEAADAPHDAKSEAAREALGRELLAFCALATVCDVMPLQDENRIIVREGLRMASEGVNTGLKALIEVTGLSGQNLTVYHAGFVLGPCLNASGRLGSAERGLRLFEETDEHKALMMAQDLKDLNDSRKSMTVQGVERARQQIIERHMEGDKVLVLYLEDCHESLAGIIAGRLKETFQRPSFVLTDTERGLLKGSGRSIEQYDMYAEMNACSDLLEKFGGHKMAGGLTLRRENLEDFHQRLQDNCVLGEDDLVETIHVDMELPPRYVDLDMVREMELLEPCGTQNPRPLFVTRDILLVSARVFGKNRNVIRLTGFDSSGTRLDMIRFEAEEAFADVIIDDLGQGEWAALIRGEGQTLIDMVYYPSINVWNGRESLQFVVQDFRVAKKTGN